MTEMTGASNRQLLRSWLILLALTGAAVAAVNWIGNVAGLMLVLTFALFKTRFVILDFMGMRRHVTMRRALTLWCMAPAITAILKAMLAGI